MFFRAVGIKEISKKTYNIDILIDSDSSTTVRNMLHDSGVVVLDVAEYPGDASSF